MKLELQRFLRTAIGVFGRLFVIDTVTNQVVFQCFTVERPPLDNQPHISCVLAGIYKIVFEMSAKFHRLLWELKNVPGRDESKIHVACFPTDLEGCIGVGETLDYDAKRGYWVTDSRTTLDALHKVLVGFNETTIQIEDRFGSIIGA